MEVFTHREQRAYNEVRTFTEYSNNPKADYFLVNKMTNKIIAGYQSYNVVNYSKYTGPENKTIYEIVHCYELKTPSRWNDIQAIDYTKAENWEII